MLASLEDYTDADNLNFLAEHKGSKELIMPVLVANGDNDLLIPTSRSWELFSKTEDAKLILYLSAGHGFIWQYTRLFAEDVAKFLDA